MRIDRTCPNSCKYILKEKENTFGIVANAESQEEFSDLLKQEMDRWVRTPQSLFADQIPLTIAETEEGREKLKKVFQNLEIPQYVPIEYLKKRLNLTDLKVKKKTTSNPEIKVKQFLDRIIEQEWEATIPFLLHHSVYEKVDFKNSYLNRIQSQNWIKKIVEYHLISSSLSEEKDQALIHFEINRKYDLTFVLKLIDDNWYIRSKILGTPTLYLGENEAVKQVAVLLTKREFSKAIMLLTKYEKIYLDSADFQYYWGMYYSMNNQKEKARKYFFRAMEFDPDFIEAAYNYAFLLHTDKREEEAEKWYRIILEKDPGNVNSLNNLASILIDRSNLDEAKTLLHKCLQIQPDFSIAQKNLDRILAIEDKQ